MDIVPYFIVYHFVNFCIIMLYFRYIYIAAQQGHTDSVGILLDRGADVESKK